MLRYLLHHWHSRARACWAAGWGQPDGGSRLGAAGRGQPAGRNLCTRMQDCLPPLPSLLPTSPSVHISGVVLFKYRTVSMVAAAVALLPPNLRGLQREAGAGCLGSGLHVAPCTKAAGQAVPVQQRVTQAEAGRIEPCMHTPQQGQATHAHQGWA